MSSYRIFVIWKLGKKYSFNVDNLDYFIAPKDFKMIICKILKELFQLFLTNEATLAPRDY